MNLRRHLKRVLATWKQVSRDNKGMTLVEIMVVITIIGLLMSIVGVSVLGSLEGAKADTTCTQIGNLKSTLTYYKIDNGRYPTSSEGLEALIRAPASAKKKKKYLDSDEIPKDGWDNAFIYNSPGSQGDHDFEIISYGADGQPGGEDENKDINSWEKCN